MPREKPSFHRTGPVAWLVLLFAWVAGGANAQTKLKVGYHTVTSGPSVVWVSKEAEIFRKYGLDVALIR